MTVGVEGLDELIATISDASEYMARGIEQAEAECREAVARRARESCPVDTGALRDSIRATPEGVAAGADYALAVELGTYFAPPRPFLRPALEREADGFRENVRGYVTRALS